MSDRKALTSEIGGGGARFRIGDDDDTSVPVSGPGSGSKSAFFSQWMNRLGGATRRRGSVGFTENNLDLPPSRVFDDDSRSNSFIDGADSRDGFSNSMLSRKRNESCSEYGMTPGDDSDAYLLRNKFRKNESDPKLGDTRVEVTRSRDRDMDSITPNVCGLGLNAAEVTASVCGLGLATVEEGKVMISDTRGDEDTSGERSGDGQIFLIDLEESRDQESGRTVLRPSSKKFSATALLQNKFAQNWFFRNSDSEDTDNLVDEENETRPSGMESDSNEDSKTGNTILRKIKNIVDKNKSQHREMNMWQPQGS